MPETPVRIYQDADGTAPLRLWLATLERKAQAECAAKLTLLEAHGHELRRPHVENLGDDVYELRVKFKRVNLRMLYFFHKQEAIIVTHGFAKERVIPPGEIALAKERMARFNANPERHTYREPQE